MQTLEGHTPESIYRDQRAKLHEQAMDLDNLEHQIDVSAGLVSPDVPQFIPSGADVQEAQEEGKTTENLGRDPGEEWDESYKEKTAFNKFVDFVTYVTSPIEAPAYGIASALVAAQESPTGDISFEDFRRGFSERLHLKYGEDVPDYFERMAEHFVGEDAHPAVKAATSIGLNIVLDPATYVGAGLTDLILKGARRMKALLSTGARSAVEAADAAIQAGKGAAQHGVEGLLNVAKQTELAPEAERMTDQILRLAWKVDKGDKKAAIALNELLEKHPVLQKARQVYDEIEVERQLDELKSIFGSTADDELIHVDVDNAAQILTQKHPDEALEEIAGNINLMRATSDNDVRAVLKNYMDAGNQIMERVRKTKPDAELLKEAQGVQLADLLGMKPKEFSEGEALGLRMALTSSAAQLVGIARKSLADPTNIRYQYAFQKALVLHNAITEKVVGVTAHAGRLLRMFQLPAEPSVRMLREVNKLAGSLTPSNVNDLTNLMKDLVAKTDSVEEPIRFLSKVGFANTKSALYKLYINAILSGPITHMRNIVSNTATLLIHPSEELLAGASAALRGDFASAKLRAAKSVAAMHGIFTGMSDVLKLASRYGRDAVDVPEELFKTFELQRKFHTASTYSQMLGASGRVGAALDYVGRFIDLPGQALLKSDQAFKLMLYRMKVNSTAAEKAVTLGRNQEEAIRLFNVLKHNPDTSTIDEAIDVAEYFTGTNQLDRVGRALRDVFALPGLNLIQPFVTTPYNFTKMGVRYSFVGNVFKDLHVALTGTDVVAKDLARARIALGTLIPGTLVWNLGDHVTGYIDTRTPMGRFMRENGMPPYSIRIGDKWVSYAGIEPVRLVLGMMVNYRNAISQLSQHSEEDKTLAEQIVATVISPFVQTVMESGLLSVYGHMNYLIEGATSGNFNVFLKDLKRMAAAMAVPNFFNQINRGMFDNTMREANGVLESIMARIPGVSHLLPARKDVWGEDRVYPHALGPDMASPINVYSADMDEVDKAIIELQPYLPRVTDELHLGDGLPPLKLTSAQIVRLEEIAGKGPDGRQPRKEIIRSIIHNPNFQYLSDDQKRAVISEVLRSTQEAAKRALLAEDPELQRQKQEQIEAYKAIMEETQARRQAAMAANGGMIQ